MTKQVPAPKGLQKPGLGLWRCIAKQWADDRLTPDARECRLLADACAEADMLAILEASLAKAIAAGDDVVKGSTGQPVTHPHVSECRRSRAQIASLLGKLGLDDPAARVTSLLSGGSGVSAAEAGRRGAMMRHHGNPNGMGA